LERKKGQSRKISVENSAGKSDSPLSFFLNLDKKLDKSEMDIFDGLAFIPYILKKNRSDGIEEDLKSFKMVKEVG
jgi:hypothetical protein